MLHRRTGSILLIAVIFCAAGLSVEPRLPDSNLPAHQQFRMDTNAVTYQPPPTRVFLDAPEKLFSPSVGQLFYEMGREISLREDATNAQIEQAVILFRAASELDTSADVTLADLLRVLSRPGPPRYLRLLYDTLIKYVDKNADRLVVRNAVRYLLEQLNTRRQREILLSRIIRDIGDSNPVITSELATELGLLYAERADDPNAARVFATAYARDRYNQLAFEKLTELVPDQISPVSNIEYLRLKLRENPLDLDSAISFAQYAQRIQLYDVAVGGYQYCSDLFNYLFPDRQLPLAVYQEWMVSCYNAPRAQTRCLQLADSFRNQGRFDLQLESLAAKAAAKGGDNELAANILRTAEQKAINEADAKTLAWYYNFVRPDANKAMDWANKAYSAEPNSPDAAALFVCALVDANQLDFAKTLVEDAPQTQLAAYAKGRLNLASGERQPALDLLRSAIDKAPGTLVAEQALRLLNEQGADYIPIYDTGVIQSALEKTVGPQLAPQFLSPDRMLSFELNTRGGRFVYASDIDGFVRITNNGYEPFVISDKGLCRGHITIDADVTGDLQGHFENIISTTASPAQPINTGNSVLVPVRLSSGPLKELLLKHPQASLTLQFTAYLDPVVTAEDDIVCAIPGIKPAISRVERPRVEVTTDFLQNRLNSLSKGRQGPKITAVQLFAGLLMENIELPQGQLPYKVAGTDKMTPILKSAMVQGLTDSDWVVKVHSMMALIPLPLDYELINAVAKGINDKTWPVRMTAVMLLNQKQGENFTRVLDYTAQYDENAYVRNMAVALGAKVPKPAQPLEQPFLELLREEVGPEEANR